MLWLLADLAVTDGQLFAFGAFLFSVIGTLFAIREKERAGWFMRTEASTAALNANTSMLEQLTRAMDERNRIVATLSEEVQSLRSEVGELRKQIERQRGAA